MTGPTQSRSRRRLVFQGLLLLALSGALLLCFGLVLFSDRLLYPVPRPLMNSAARYGALDPAGLGMPFESMKLPASGGLSLAGWYVPRAGSRKAVVMIHGHRENRVSMLKFGRRLWERGFALLMCDQRHHGESPGERFTMGYAEWEDAHSAVKWLEQKGFPANAVAAYGVSMGGMIAIKAQSEGQPFAAVVADSASSDIRQTIADYGRRDYGSPEWFARWSLGMAEWRGDYDLDRMVARVLVRRIKKPQLFVHGEADDRIPMFHSHILAGMAGGPAETFFVPGAKHAEAFDKNPDNYSRVVAGFLEKSVGESPPTSSSNGGR